jgi:hypothetical protein
MTVCSLVSISGGQIEEGQLWRHLASMGVRHDDEAHPKFGNTKVGGGGAKQVVNPVTPIALDSAPDFNP